MSQGSRRRGKGPGQQGQGQGQPGKGQGQQGKGGNAGGQQAKGQNRNAGQGGGRNRPKNKPKARTGDPKRPFWSNDTAEARVRELIGEVRPAQDPTALVRSLGSPPLGRFGDTAPHYYAAVYEKAQRFAVAMATANGVRIVDPDAEADEPGADPVAVGAGDADGQGAPA